MKFLSAEWRKLILANYIVDKALLEPHVPYGTELDYWNGNLYISLVGFMFVNTKVLGIPIPFHRNFEEINLRFYVRYKHQGEWRRGVVFLKEIVPKMMISLVANTVYGEHYETLKMKHQIQHQKEALSVEYEVHKNNQWHKIKAIANAQKQTIITGSEAEFITEHYWGYTKLKERKTSQYEVSHPTWDFYKVQEFTTKGDFAMIYGQEYGFINDNPHSVYLAEGSEIAVLKGNPIT